MKTHKLKILIILLIVLALVGSWGWFRYLQTGPDSRELEELKREISELQARLESSEENLTSSEEEKSEEEEALRVKTARAELQEREETISYDGVIEPSRTTLVIPRMPGEVTRVLVEEGEQVNQGDLLLEMDTREIDKNIEQAEAGVEAARTQLEMAEEGLREEEIDQIKETVKQAETQLELAEASYERIKALRDEGIVSEQEYEQVLMEKNMAHSNLVSAMINLDMAQSGARDLEIRAARAQLRQAEIQLELAEMARDDARVTAPRDGVIISRDVEPGELVGEAQPPLVIGNLDPLHLTVRVGERDIGKIETGQKAQISLRALPDKEIMGEVSRVSPVADPDSRLFGVTIEVSNPDHQIRPGMYAEASVILDSGPAYPLVPTEAIYYDNQAPYVYTISEGRASPRHISTGEEENGKTAITSGLRAGEEVIIEADGELAPGNLVESGEEDFR